MNSDFEIAQDRDWETILENKEKELDSREEALYRATEYGDPETSIPFSAIVLEMLTSGKVSRLYWVSDVNPDVDWHEAVNEACIQLGLGDDDLSPYVRKSGPQIEFYL
ncbi:MAG: hypothetical protein HC890_12625 [Chloroflexaceae bacterium]|nr:hypothetical protein [Chloroflexaceae bacterium]